jgi:riboflavin kinase/FMN adenylyltransferase
MKITDALAIETHRPTAVAVGFFDGVHRGHLAVIEAALAQKARGLDACVFSFSAHRGLPAAKRGTRLLQSASLKQQVIRELGADWLLLPDFSDLMWLSPEQFAIGVLLEGLSARVVCCGWDYRFGRGAAAGPKELSELLSPCGVEVLQIGAVLDSGEPISSTRVRAALAQGDIATANRLLGRPFAIDFPVEHGRGLGRKLGFPTANQPIAEQYARPKFGVYATRVLIGGLAHPAVTNVGVKPTVGSDCVVAESYVPGWSGDLYDRQIETQFLEYLRPERRFDSLLQLTEAIRADAQRAVELHQGL